MQSMQTNTRGNASAPRARAWLEQLSDAELLDGTRRLVGRSIQLLAELLVHLGEVEARGIHRTRACSSLYAYCIYELRFSEDEAFRRVAAARLVRRFPALLDALASGELHLTGLLMLGPHLTEANFLEVLARAKHRTKRELARLVRILDPLPAVPARIEPLGPAPARLVPPEPSWQAFIESTCPVRELAPGDRPREWIESANDWSASSAELGGSTVGARTGDRASASAGAGDHGEERATVAAPERVDPTAVKRLEPERYKVQFTATEEYVRLVEEAKALLSHAVPNVTLEELQMRAMRALVAELKKKKYATVAGSPARAVESESINALPQAASRTRHQRTDSLERDAKRPRADALERDAKQPRADGLEQHAHPKDAIDQVTEQPHTRQRGRHIPAVVRRTVFERDDNRCSYIDANGTRCPATHRLEFHHLKPFASGGDHGASNLTLRCRAHNALAAEEDFGRELIADRKSSLRHEPFGSFER